MILSDILKVRKPNMIDIQHFNVRIFEGVNKINEETLYIKYSAEFASKFWSFDKFWIWGFLF